MPERKLMIYPKGSSRPIMLTDKDGKESVHDLKASLEEIFESDKIFAISTSDDLLLGKPSEIGFIQVRTENEFEDFELIPDYSGQEVIASPDLTEALEKLDQSITDPAIQEIVENYSETPKVETAADYDLIITDD